VEGVKGWGRLGAGRKAIGRELAALVGWFVDKRWERKAKAEVGRTYGQA
jgi:hypothetical protein